MSQSPNRFERWNPWWMLSAGVGLVAVLLLVVLCFGDSTWNRNIFLFQFYVLKRDVSRPENFTGTLKSWHPNGKLSGMVPFEKGALHGTVIFWHTNGVKKEEMPYVMGERHGDWFSWDVSGKLKNKCTYKDGEPWEGVCQIRDMKAFLGVYKDGKPWEGYLPAQNDQTKAEDWFYHLNGVRVSQESYTAAKHLPTNAHVIGIGVWKTKTASTEQP